MKLKLYEKFKSLLSWITRIKENLLSKQICSFCKLLHNLVKCFIRIYHMVSLTILNSRGNYFKL